jgi:transcriptional regulator with GAF, ATPase, and Fis domain
MLHIQPQGGSGEVVVDVRIIAATNADLEQATATQTFRPDLYQRLSVLPVHLPSLAARSEDILWLIHHYLNLDSALTKARRVSGRLGELLLLYSWPGNVREAMNLSKRLLTLAPDAVTLDLDVLPKDLQEKLAQSPRCHERSASLLSSTSEASKPTITSDLLVRLLAENQGLIAPVARLLKRSPRQIRRWMERFGLRDRKENEQSETARQKIDRVRAAKGDEGGGKVPSDS